MTSDERILLGVIIWLSNHYDLGDKRLKRKVLNRVKLILDHYDPPMACQTEARDFGQKLEYEQKKDRVKHPA